MPSNVYTILFLYQCFYKVLYMCDTINFDLDLDSTLESISARDKCLSSFCVTPIFANLGGAYYMYKLRRGLLYVQR